MGQAQHRVSSVGMSILAVPLILLINLGGGYKLSIVATSALPISLPRSSRCSSYGLEVMMNSMCGRQLAGAAASRLIDLLETPFSTTAPPLFHGHDVVSRTLVTPTVRPTTTALRSRTYHSPLPRGITALVGPSDSGRRR